MDFYTLPYVNRPVNASDIRVPGSKSISQRAICCASLAPGTSELTGVLASEDIELTSSAFKKLGVNMSSDGDRLVINGTGGHISPGPIEIFLGNNGTGMRFITSVCALGAGEYLLTGTDRMSERPIDALLCALERWGAVAESVEGTGCPPVRIIASGISGGPTSIDASKSSQFLSSLMLVAPCARKDCSISLASGLVSRPYVELTTRVMASFGATITEDNGVINIPASGYAPAMYEVEGDASSASYFWAAAAVTGGSVLVENVPSNSMQGDAYFARLLEMMGCAVECSPGGTRVTGPSGGSLKAIDIDMSKWPDMVPTLAVVAAFAKGVTVIRNVAHLRIKETDRLSAISSELRSIGVEVKEFEDGLEIVGAEPANLRPVKIKTYNDHRIAMCFAVAGLRIKGLTVEDPACVKKSFPDFWKVWDSMIEN